MGTTSEYWNDMLNHTDPRIKDRLFVGNPIPPGLTIISYLAFLFLGPVWMKNKEPFKLTNVLVVYNFGLVLLNALYIQRDMDNLVSAKAYEMLVTLTFKQQYLLFGGWLFDYSWSCQPVDYSYSPQALRMLDAVYLFYIAKFMELLDTVLFILRKKNNQVTFLHVFHHGALPMFWWWGVKIVPGGSFGFHGVVNSFVHVVMYTYYGLAGLGPKVQKYLWWKRYVTILQLVQFLSVTIFNAQFLFIECDIPLRYIAVSQILCTIIAALFLNFYIKTYKQNKKSDSTLKHQSQKNKFLVHQCAVSDEVIKDNSFSSSGSIKNGSLSRRNVPIK